jgi:hypothetical protein
MTPPHQRFSEILTALGKWTDCESPKPGQLNPSFAGKICNEKMSFKHFLGKPIYNAEAVLKTYELFIYGDVHYITNLCCKNVLRKSLWFAFLLLIFLIIINIFSWIWSTEKYTGKNMHKIISTFIHSLWCILNIMLPACSPNFAEAVRTT